jgi:hypothetical protein
MLMNPFAVPNNVDTASGDRFYPLAVVLLMVGAVLMAAVPAAAEDRAAGDWTMSSDGLPTSGTYFGVAFGDVDEDGNLDLVGAADGSGLRVFLGDGAGSWTAVSGHPATSGGYGDVVLGDVDGDGHLDIVAGSPGNGAGNPRGLHLWRGDGSGGFTDATSGSGLPTTGYWRGVDTGDVNGDGDLDVAACSGYGSSEGIHVYLGDGDGRFSDASAGLPGNQDRDSNVALADFDGDGDLDVAAGGAAGVDVYLVAKGGGGDLVWTQSSSGLPDRRMSGVSAADWNKDGSVDLVLSAYNAGSGNGVYAYENTGGGAGWRSASSGLPDDGDYIENAVGDLDGDGNADILTAGSYGGEYGIHAYYGDGSGSWAESSPGFPDNVQYVGVDLGDVDGDGTLDLAVGKRTRGGGLEVWKNPSSQVPPPQPLVELSFPSGGESLTGGSSHEVEWAISSGTPGFEVTLSYSTDGGTTFTRVIAEDVGQADAGAGAASWAVPVINSENVRVRAEVLDAASQAVVRSGLDFEIDSTPPDVSSHFPNDDATEVSTGTMVIVTFSEGMSEASAGAVSISGPGDPELSEPSWSGTQLTLATDGLQSDAQYTVTVGTDATDDSLPGNAMEAATSFSFTTGSGVAPTPPIVRSTDPDHDETGVPVGGSVTISFSKAMDLAATRSAITVSPDLDWSPVWSEGDTVVALDPVGTLTANTRYTVTVSGAAMAADGTGMDVAYTFRFTTGDPPDLTPPGVSDNYPPDRQREISPYLEEVTITFSEPMDTSSVEAALTVSPGSVTSTTWRVGDTVLVLGLDMTEGQRYTVTVGTGATDKAGNPLTEEFAFFFVTKEFEDQAEETPGMTAPAAALALLSSLLVAGLRRRG